MMMTAGRWTRAIPVILLATLAASGLATITPAHAQEQIPALFSAIPEGTTAPPRG